MLSAGTTPRRYVTSPEMAEAIRKWSEPMTETPETISGSCVLVTVSQSELDALHDLKARWQKWKARVR